MILSILFIVSNVTILSLLEHIHQHTPQPGHQYFPSLLEYQQSHMMSHELSKSLDEIRNLDPKEPLSTTNLGLLLLDHINRSITDERKFNRDVADENLKAAIESSDIRFKALIDLFHKHVSSQAEQFSDLELKLDSKTTYLEQLLYSLQSDNKALKNELEKHMKSCHNNESSCFSCNKSFQELTTSGQHTTSYHGTDQELPNTIVPEQYDKDHPILPFCSLCGKTFGSTEEVKNHVDTEHVAQANRGSQHQELNECVQISLPLSFPSPPYCCQLCGTAFLAVDALREHVDFKHWSMSPPNLTPNFELHCNNCNMIFNNMVALNLHTRNNHSSPNMPIESPSSHSCVPALQVVNSCNICSDSFASCSNQGEHTTSKHGQIFRDEECESHHTIQSPDIQVANNSLHTSPTYRDDQCIPQYDGNDTIESLDYNQSVVNPPDTVHVADFALNQDKQLSRLAKHAQIPDFDIDVTSPTNVNIQCSSAFYQLVAKPVLSSLLVPVSSKGGVQITCSDLIKSKHDQLSRDVNVVLHFKVGNSEAQESATVHLHQTQQKVQVQGLAAPWFSNQFLKQKFELEARNKASTIRNLNKTISTSVTSLESSSGTTTVSASLVPCPNCNMPIKCNSKTSICKKCNKKLHNSKQNPCLLRHKCNETAVQAPGTPTGSATNAPSVPAVSLFPADSFSGTVTTSGSSVPVASPVVGTKANQSELPPTEQGLLNTTDSSSILVTPPPSSSMTLSVTAPVFTQMSNNQSSQSSKVPRKPKNPAGHTKSPEELELEFTKRELALVKVNIQKLEAENKDIKQKNEILTKTVKMFEDRNLKEVNDKVNPSPTASTRKDCDSCTNCQHQSSTDKDILSDLLRFFMRIVEGKTLCDHKLLPQTTLSPDKASNKPGQPQVPLSQVQAAPARYHQPEIQPATELIRSNLMTSGDIPATSSPLRAPLSDSIVSVDEFAMDVNEESRTHLNSNLMTTQKNLRLPQN